MKIDSIIDLYCLISEGTSSVPSRKKSMKLRKMALNSLLPMVKMAFDTRRINQETDYNPRRGLQNYNRSEAFVTEQMSQKIKNFAKLKHALNSLKITYGKEPEWQDSNARVLLSTLDKGLRTNINDGDYSDSQPGVGNLNYIEELLHVRYRLGFDDLTKMAESDLKKVILAKDEELIHKDMNDSLEITKHDVATKSYDSLLEKLFGNVRATKENPEVERTVTITIKDKFVG